MKRVKMAIMALSAITSVGSAFAFSPAAKTNATTYYAVPSGSSFHWTSVKPAHAKCTQSALPAICQITTTNQPVDGAVPTGHTANNTIFN